MSGCWTPIDLAAWNLPSESAFDKDSPQVTVVGYISNFPTTKDLQQEVVVTVSRLRYGNEWHTIEGQARLTTTPCMRYLHLTFALYRHCDQLPQFFIYPC
jgi:hypothetical protein